MSYDPAHIERKWTIHWLKLFHTKSEQEKARQFCRRFFQLLQVSFLIVFYAWYDSQLWSYVGEEDIEQAQSLRRQKHARWLTDTLLSLGPTFIKIGQSISTRVDLIRKEYIEALSKLQDRVPPFPYHQVQEIVKKELGSTPEELFSAFDPEPLAAASLGQVHRAWLRSNPDNPQNPSQTTEIILKVQRPNLMETFCLDLAILRKLAHFLQHNTDLGRSREWVNIVDEFGKTLFEEVDYIQEGRNADRFREAFKNHPGVSIPEIHWEYTAHRVIAQEYVAGTKINNITQLEAQGFNLAELADTCVKAYFQQILVDGFYHADPHPGNIAVKPNGQLVFYDFGMTGSIPEDTRLTIVEAFLNIIHKKPDSLLNNLLELDMIGANADLEIIRQLITWAIENYYDAPHDELNFEQLTEEMAELMYAYPFKLPPNFTFMIRALLTLEGVATYLNPSIQFLAVAVDYAQQFLTRSLSLDYLVKKGKDFLHSGLEQVTPLQKRSGSRVRLHHDEWTPLARYVKVGFTFLALGQGALFLLLAVLFLIERGSLNHSNWINQPFVWGMVAGFVFLLSLLLLAGLVTLITFPARRRPIRFKPSPTPKQKTQTR